MRAQHFTVRKNESEVEVLVVGRPVTGNEERQWLDGKERAPRVCIVISECVWKKYRNCGSPVADGWWCVNNALWELGASVTEKTTK